MTPHREGGVTGTPLPAWKTSLPSRNEDHFHRPRLAERLQLCRRRLTVLSAPFGFGKTTMLADACLRERDQGTNVVWLQCDRGLTVETLLNQLDLSAHAFLGDRPHTPLQPERATDHPLSQPWVARLASLTSAIEKTGEPCVLALDDVECMEPTDSTALIQWLCATRPLTCIWP